MTEALSGSSDIKMDYMKLLVAELQNQNPLEPMDNNEMASQLSQFSMLEQMESMNSNFAKTLESIEHDHAEECADYQSHSRERRDELSVSSRECQDWIPKSGHEILKTKLAFGSCRIPDQYAGCDEYHESGKGRFRNHASVSDQLTAGFIRQLLGSSPPSNKRVETRDRSAGDNDKKHGPERASLAVERDKGGGIQWRMCNDEAKIPQPKAQKENPGADVISRLKEKPYWQRRSKKAVNDQDEKPEFLA